ncbi:MAG: phosphate ABC transporter permease PstA [Thioalkalispiraceae bacterium]
MKKWFKSGDPMIWLNAAAVSTSLIIVIGLLALIAVRGLGHFWPKPVMEALYVAPDNAQTRLLGEIHDNETVNVEQLREMGMQIDTDSETMTRSLIKTGNRDITGRDFKWAYDLYLEKVDYPAVAMTLERREWGNFYGYLEAIHENGKQVADKQTAWQELQTRLERTHQLHQAIRDIEKGAIGDINYQIEELRLEERRLQLDEVTDQAPYKAIEAQRKRLQEDYEALQGKLTDLYQQIKRDALIASTVEGKQVTIPLQNIVRSYRANDLNILQKIGLYFERLWEFVSDEPREANTEGGIFPAIFGTVLMVIIMAILVTPFGVVAAVYLREYAKQGPLTRTIRIAVNNLAGVPSIVYGVFGLGFFVYFLGGNIDRLFYPEAAPAPVFGTPGILWSSLTLAILTVPVVIVATEEGLSRIPRSIREGSLALGATKAETLWRTVIPMATPAMMTGLILAVARAAGEVAPLMLVGVVKLAPSLALDSNAPFVHLERKFMHLGFHIYDVGFQSPNVEAARPLVYATALLLVVIIVALNLVAIYIRNRLREKYKALES